jgi:hypothetical protein
LAKDGVTLFKNALRQANIDFTGELSRSMHFEVNAQVNGFVAVADIYFREYGRYVDMNKLIYSKLPPIEVFERWVAQVGIEKFAFIPGYTSKSKAVPTTEIAIERIARQIAFHRRMIPIYKPDQKRKWYNKNKMAYLRVMRKEMGIKMAEVSLKYIKPV